MSVQKIAATWSTGFESCMQKSVQSKYKNKNN